MTLVDRLQLLRRVSASAPVAVAALVAANLVPLVGVAFFGWDIATILFLYWLENGIVGVLNVPRILLAAGRPKRRPEPGRLYTAAFFTVHYGIFWLVHGMFIAVLTGNLSGFGLLEPLRIALGDAGIIIGALALLGSHAVSLLTNYVGRREYVGISPGSQMWQPYPRMIVLHTTIVLGGVFVLEMNQPHMLVVLLVALKTGLDLGLHVLDHLRARRRANVTAASAG